jgi:hypothetical protein
MPSRYHPPLIPPRSKDASMGGLHGWRHWIVIASFAFLASCQSFPVLTGSSSIVKTELDNGLPGKHQMRVSQFAFYSDSNLDVPKNQPLFKELSALREGVFKELQLPPSNTMISVYIFEDRAKYETYMRGKYPELPKRRAFFVAQPSRFGGGEQLLVYTSWGDRVQQDLRHELTHALLHSALKDVPLWLDEGLAEYFEMPSSWKGVNYQHLEAMRGAKFDLDRLEKLGDVQQMTPAEYREAWAWTHLMLRTTPGAKQVLLAYLADLRSNSRSGPLKPRLEREFPVPDDAVRRHLADLDLGKPRNATTAAN